MPFNLKSASNQTVYHTIAYCFMCLIDFNHGIPLIQEDDSSYYWCSFASNSWKEEVTEFWWPFLEEMDE